MIRVLLRHHDKEILSEENPVLVTEGKELDTLCWFVPLLNYYNCEFAFYINDDTCRVNHKYLFDVLYYIILYYYYLCYSVFMHCISTVTDMI